MQCRNMSIINYLKREQKSILVLLLASIRSLNLIQGHPRSLWGSWWGYKMAGVGGGFRAGLVVTNGWDCGGKWMETNGG